MYTIACKDKTEVSCIIGNALAEIEPPCGDCDEGVITLSGKDYAGQSMKIQVRDDNVLIVDGNALIIEEIRKRGCRNDR